MGHRVCETPEIICRLDMSGMPVSPGASKCSLFTLAPPRLQDLKRLRTSVQRSVGLFFPKGLLRASAIPLPITPLPEHSFTTCLLTDQSANQETCFMVSPWVIHSLREQELITCWSRRHHLWFSKGPKLERGSHLDGAYGLAEKEAGDRDTYDRHISL